MSASQFHLIAGAPTPVGPFSHATESEGWVFVTGQMPTDPDDRHKPLPPDIEGQTRAVMRNLEIVLEGLSLGWPDVLQVRAYLTHFEDEFARFNAVYETYFPADRRPARTCIGVTALAVGARVEVDLLVKRP
jgi:reactive intermediate/imine deaminase